MTAADTALRSDLGLYDYLPWPNRPKIVWPGNKKIAVWIAPNIEFYEYDPPNNPTRTPWARPNPDVLQYSHRDYGNRAGWQRMMAAMDRCGFRGSVSLNVAPGPTIVLLALACFVLAWPTGLWLRSREASHA